MVSFCGVSPQRLKPLAEPVDSCLNIAMIRGTFSRLLGFVVLLLVVGVQNHCAFEYFFSVQEASATEIPCGDSAPDSQNPTSSHEHGQPHALQSLMAERASPELAKTPLMFLSLFFVSTLSLSFALAEKVRSQSMRSSGLAVCPLPSDSASRLVTLLLVAPQAPPGSLQ